MFSTIFQAVPLHYRVRVGVQINKGFVFRTLDFSTHEIKRVRWRQKKNETFFFLFFYHLLTHRVLPLFIICLELISTIGSSDIFKY